MESALSHVVEDILASGPTVLLAAKTDGSVFYDKLTPSIAEEEM
jgi:hypothetical protein